MLVDLKFPLRIGSDQFLCRDCSTDTHKNGEYYMVHDTVWEQAGNVHGMLCVGCIEARLQRTLSSTDFTDVPANREEFSVKSARLKDRLTRVGNFSPH